MTSPMASRSDGDEETGRKPTPLGYAILAQLKKKGLSQRKAEELAGIKGGGGYLTRLIYGVRGKRMDLTHMRNLERVLDFPAGAFSHEGATPPVRISISEQTPRDMAAAAAKQVGIREQAIGSSEPLEGPTATALDWLEDMIHRERAMQRTSIAEKKPVPNLKVVPKHPPMPVSHRNGERLQPGDTSSIAERFAQQAAKVLAKPRPEPPAKKLSGDEDDET